MEEKQGINIIREEELEDSENIIINEVDGLPNLHPNYEQLELEFERERDIDDANIRSIDELVHDEDLPTSVIVTNVDPRVFKGDDLKVLNTFCVLYQGENITLGLYRYYLFFYSQL